MVKKDGTKGCSATPGGGGIPPRGGSPSKVK